MNKCCEKCIRTYPVSEVYKNDPNKGWSCTNRVCRCHSQEKEETTTSQAILLDMYEREGLVGIEKHIAKERTQFVDELRGKLEARRCEPGDIVTGWIVSMADVYALLPEQESK